MNRPILSNCWLNPHDTQDRASLQPSQTAITQNHCRNADFFSSLLGSDYAH